jgi:hypothetical protein
VRREVFLTTSRRDVVLRLTFFPNTHPPSPSLNFEVFF